MNRLQRWWNTTTGTISALSGKQNVNVAALKAVLAKNAGQPVTNWEEMLKFAYQTAATELGKQVDELTAQERSLAEQRMRVQKAAKSLVDKAIDMNVIEDALDSANLTKQTALATTKKQ